MNCISLPQGVGVVLKIAIPTLNVPKYSCSNMLWEQSEGQSIPSRNTHNYLILDNLPYRLTLPRLASCL